VTGACVEVSEMQHRAFVFNGVISFEHQTDSDQLLDAVESAIMVVFVQCLHSPEWKDVIAVMHYGEKLIRA
jgi:hypothetical protein